MAEEQGLVRVQIVDVPGYVKGVITRFSEREVVALEKKGAVKRVEGATAAKGKKKSDKTAPEVNTKS